MDVMGNVKDIFSGDDLFGGEEGIDELPDDEVVIEPDDTQYQFIKLAEFRGAIQEAKVDRFGHFSLKLNVPAEDKYLAMPLTDVRGVLMVFSVYQPVEIHGERDGG